MQHSILIIALLISSVLFAQTSKETELEEGQTIEVSVTNALSDKGIIYFSLHTKETFRKAKAMYSESSKIENGKAEVTFKNVPEGEYAIICFHDENENNKMDFELNGMPKESYGTSNNPMSYGPPQFEPSKFEVTNKNLSLEIKF
ncbi:DUF2141 domain-containing protein [Lutibacter sp. TH_r2]|uniref:DUF2141 domain-containing protein n=1 Tax=Lutibacter sp. TH_r2 TaxID=3082083 RepID=UPI0029544068|nr:DUF2141 domain-containing protein [Lutibacter sp. TH_r2]MDV7187398.1 DUF2141 domain-containing protein [Lutibacter sp. TH_r2]